MSKAPPDQKTVGLPFGIGFLLALLVLVFLGLASETMPDPVPASAPPTEFSSARALAHLKHIAARPHPTGTPENAEVRRYLLAELARLGLTAEVQSGFGFQESRQWGVAGKVHNVVARLPGTGPAPRQAVLLSAHFDSVPNGPGAADNGASVAAILEALRAIRAGKPLRNDLLVLFSDGEEAGLLGSELYVRQHPSVRDVGLALNFEYRGSSGPMLMFETAGGNGNMVAALATSRASPIANSLLFEIYKRMPNDTDMTSFKYARLAGMNFAAIEKPSTYHMQHDSIEELDHASLQQEGELVLGLARHFGSTQLAGLKSADRVYFNLPFAGIVHYPVGMANVLAGVGVALFMALLFLAVRKNQVRLGRVAGGAFAFAGGTLLIAIACQLIWMTVCLVHPDYNLLDSPYNSMTYLLAIAALATALFITLQTGWERWMSAFELGLGAMLVWTALHVAAAIAMPGATFMLAWPMLPLLLALLLTVGIWMPLPARAALLLAGAAPALLLCVPLVRMLFNGLGPHIFVATGLVIALLLGLLGPLLALLNRARLAMYTALAIGVCALVAGTVTSEFDAAQPRPSNLFYAWNASSNEAFWISRDDELDDWNRKYFKGVDAPRKVPELFGAGSPRLYWAAKAPLTAGLQAPELEVLSEEDEDGANRNIVMRVRTRRNAPAITIKIEGTPVLSSVVQGKAFATKDTERWVFESYGLNDEWLEVKFTVSAGKPFLVRLSDETYGLPAAEVASRSKEVVPGMYGTSGDTVRAVHIREFTE